MDRFFIYVEKKETRTKKVKEEKDLFKKFI